MVLCGKPMVHVAHLNTNRRWRTKTYKFI